MIIYHQLDSPITGETREMKFDADTMETDIHNANALILKKNTSEVARVFICAGEWIAFESALEKKGKPANA